MNLFTSVLSLVGSSASAYIMARNMRDIKTRPNMLAGLQLAESGSVPLLEALGERAAAEGDEWLAERLQRHANDERRHGHIFANGLRNLNKQVIDPETLRQRREAEAKAAEANPSQSQKKNRSPFFDAYFRGYTAEELKAENFEWRVFFPSTYTLELDACKDFERMARSLPDDPQSEKLRQGIFSVARDEERHAAYLFEAMTRRYSYAQVTEMVDEWRQRKVDALLAMVGNFAQGRGNSQSLVQDGVPDGEAESEASSALGFEEATSETEAIAA